MWDVIANLIVDEALDDILLVRSHYHASNLSVIRLGKEISRVRGVATVFEGNKVVFLIAGHVVGVHHASGCVNLSRILIDEFRPWLMDGILVFPKLLPLQLAGVFRWGADFLRAPSAVTDIVLNILLPDIGVRGTGSQSRVRVNVRWANTG